MYSSSEKQDHRPGEVNNTIQDGSRNSMVMGRKRKNDKELGGTRNLGRLSCERGALWGLKGISAKLSKPPTAAVQFLKNTKGQKARLSKETHRVGGVAVHCGQTRI